MTRPARRALLLAAWPLAFGLTLVGLPAGAPPADAGVQAAPPPAGATPDRVFEAVVQDGAVAGGGAYRVRARTGERVRLVVTSDVADEVRVGRARRRVPIAAGTTVEVDFTAETAGALDVELDRRGLRLLTIEVEPGPVEGRRRESAPWLGRLAAGAAAALVVAFATPLLRRRLRLRLPWGEGHERWVTTAFVEVPAPVVEARAPAATSTTATGRATAEGHGTSLRRAAAASLGVLPPPATPTAPAGAGDDQEEHRPRLRYMPALDGLRAVAVIAVLAYHADLPWARGGFLGVDVFFVISGYLITALLLADWRTSGRLHLLRFWRRRALRLLPALVVLLAVVSVAVPLLAPDQSSRLRGVLFAALTYMSNWRLVF